MKVLFLKLHCFLCGYEMLVKINHNPMCVSCGKQKMVVIGHVHKEE
jgi:hypothetical protein